MARYLKQKKKNRTGPVILLILLLLIMVACVVVILIEWNKWFPNSDFDSSVYHNTESLHAVTDIPLPSGDLQTGSQPVSEAADAPLAENPVKFEDLQAINDDVYAWVYVPGTNVDYPIFQSAVDEDDNLYLHHNIYKKFEFQGVVYSQKANSKEFTDRVTVIYGHNMLNDSMFSTLDMFLDRTFFDEHPYFYIYTPGHILTYEIVSAHQYDKRHILNSFDFSNDEIYQEWLDMISNPKTLVSNVRDGVKLSLESRIVTLSTCINHGTARYLIQGVLVNDEPTK